jgi:hypothetical protein
MQTGPFTLISSAINFNVKKQTVAIAGDGAGVGDMIKVNLNS